MSGITDALTGAIGDAGVYAVFALMFVDAIFPAGSEIVMLYAGAVAAGAFPDSQVTLFGVEIESTAWAYVVMSLAGALGYWLGSLLGWAIGRYGGHPLVMRYGRFVHLDEDEAGPRGGVVRASRRCGSLLSAQRSRRPLVHLDPGRRRRDALRARTRCYSLLGSLPWAFGFAAAGYRARQGLGARPRQLPLGRLRRGRRSSSPPSST